METNNRDGGFIPYPTNRVVGTIAAAEHADSAVEALVEAGFERQSIDVLRGEEDVRRLDPAGAEHGLLERLQRALIRTGGPVEEYKHLTHHVADVRAGRSVIMVMAPERDARIVAADILNAHGAEFVGFYGRWAWQGLPTTIAAAGPNTVTPSLAKADQPEAIPRLFVEAWNNRDPDAIASLFNPHAEFVNVTGLWWHDRPSIRKAHAYGLGRIFDASALTVDELRVNRLSDDVAVVHAAMTLSGQNRSCGDRATRIPEEHLLLCRSSGERSLDVRVGAQHRRGAGHGNECCRRRRNASGSELSARSRVVIAHRV